VIIASGSNGVRDVFEEIFAPESLEPVDPTVAARRHMRALKRRFNEDVTVRDDSAGFAVALGGRPIRTPARRTPAPPNFSSRKPQIDPDTRITTKSRTGTCVPPDQSWKE